MQQFDFSLIETDRPLAIFLDIDGTLIELARTPGSVTVPPDLSPLLEKLHKDSAFALITGRPIESADRLFHPLKFPISGLHGGEFRFNHHFERAKVSSVPQEWRDGGKSLAKKLEGVFYEEKHYGYSLHFRHTPQYGPEVMAYMAEQVSGNDEFNLLHASMAGEIRPNGVDKGKAIEWFMRHPEFEGRHPVFFGDDLTDEDGFQAIAALGGTSVQVGPRRPSSAHYQLPNPESLRALLAKLELREKQNT
jgi:trehalose 6-phosphate phosphatase